MIFTDGGSARPDVSMIACTSTRPCTPAWRRRSGYCSGGRVSSSGRSDDRLHEYLIGRRHDARADTAFDARARVVLGIEVLLQIDRRNVRRNVRRRDDGLEALQL